MALITDTIQTCNLNRFTPTSIVDRIYMSKGLNLMGMRFISFGISKTILKGLASKQLPLYIKNKIHIT